MKKIRVTLYIIFLVYMAITLYMGLNVDQMISRFGLLSFFRLFQNWLTYGNLFFILLLIIENIHIYYLKRKIKNLDEDRNDLILTLNDLRRQVNELNGLKEKKASE